MKDLVKIIRANPGCVAIVDNDSWQLYRKHPDSAPGDDAKYDAWVKANLLAQNGEVKPRGDGYGSGCGYGGDILQALAVIVGIKVEGV